MTAVDSIPAPSYQKSGADVFDFSDETLVDDSIQQIQFVKLFNLQRGLPVDNLDGGSKYWQFQQNDLMSFYLWSRSMLKLTFRIIKDDNPATDEVATFTSDVRSTFRRIRCLLGGQVIHDCPDYSWLLAIQDYIWWTQQYLDTVGGEMGAFPNSNDQYGTEQRTGEWRGYSGNAGGAGGTNTTLNWTDSPLCGTGIRASMSNGGDGVVNAAGTTMSFFVPLYHIIPALQYFDRVVRGLQFELELWDSLNAIRVVNPTAGNNGALWQWQNNGIELWCRRVTPTSTYNLVLQEQLNKGVDMITKFPYPNVYRFSVPYGQQSREQLVVSTASRPLHATVMFQLQKFTEDGIVAGESAQMFPSDYFEHNWIRSMSMYINGIKAPQEGINCEFDEFKTPAPSSAGIPSAYPPYVDKENVVDGSNAYYWYLRHCGQFKAPYLNNFQEGTGTLSFIDWKNKMPVYSFDLSTHEISSWAGGASQINIRYNANPPQWQSSAGVIPPADIGDMFMYVIVWTEATLGIHMENFNNYCTLT
jgi:hypothetical protein